MGVGRYVPTKEGQKVGSVLVLAMPEVVRALIITPRYLIGNGILKPKRTVIRVWAEEV